MMYRKSEKNENGSVTLFALIAIIFMCIILINVYIASKNSTQLKQIEKIKAEYSSHESIDDVYNRIYSQFKDYIILQSGPKKTEYESNENVDYTGITLIKHNELLGDEVIDSKLYKITSTKNDDSTNNIRYQITIQYEDKTWTIDTYKKGWYGRTSTSWYYYKNHQKVTRMQNLSYVRPTDGKEFINTYLFNNDGLMLTGWKQNSDGTYYYFHETEGLNSAASTLNGQQLVEAGFPRGSMIKSNWAKITSVGTSNSYWYYFNANGIMLTGWQQIGAYWYYMNKSGSMVTGWLQDGSSWYFLRQHTNQYGTGPEGSMLANTSAYIGNKTYYFNSSGVCTNP